MAQKMPATTRQDRAVDGLNFLKKCLAVTSCRWRQLDDSGEDALLPPPLFP
jgi:hypothetical protein